MPVAEYTFAFFRGDPDPVLTQSLSFASDVEAIREGGDLLRAQQDATIPAPATSICVARGNGDDAEWLGAWDWDQGAHWRPEE